jgi:hypothetical protein
VFGVLIIIIFLYRYEVRVDMRLIGCVNSAVPFVRCK